MTGLKSTFVAAVAAVVLSSGIAFAQAPAAGQAPAVAPPATAPPAAIPSAAPKADASAPVAAVKKAAVAAPKKLPPNNANRTPESLACSAELDAKGIHGKAAGRPAAMRKCVAAAKKGNTTAAAPGTAPANAAVKKN